MKTFKEYLSLMESLPTRPAGYDVYGDPVQYEADSVIIPWEYLTRELPIHRRIKPQRQWWEKPIYQETEVPLPDNYNEEGDAFTIRPEPGSGPEPPSWSVPLRRPKPPPSWEDPPRFTGDQA